MMKKVKPYKYQRIGIKKILSFGTRVLLADEMGLGKSCQALLASKKKKIRKIVIICPASLKWNWANEVRLWLNRSSTILSKRTPTKDEKEKLLNKNILIINYDILGDWKNKDSWVRYIRNVIKPELIIVDEAHNIKSMQAQRCKAVRYLAKKTKYQIYTTGTPITSTPVDLFPILNNIMPDLFPSFRAFASRYSKPEWTPWGIKYKGARRLKELNKLLKNTCMIRRLQKDVLKDLPPKTKIIIPIELSPTEWKEYKTAEDDFKSWLMKTYPSKAKKNRSAARLEKFGYLRRLIGTLKIKHIKKWINEFLEDTDKKVIFFGIHKFMVRGLHNEYPDVSTLIDGSVKGEERQEAIDMFRDNKKIRIKFANIIAGGVGWNGTVADTCVFGELDWNPTNHSQAAKRLHRIGQKKKTFEIYLIVKGTIEEKMIKINDAKQNIIDDAIDNGKSSDINIMEILEEHLLENK